MSYAELANFNQAQRDRWVARMAASVPAGARVLDVGAGEARYRSLFEHCEYKTQDFGQYGGNTSGLLAEGWHYAPLDYVCDAADIPVPDASFDVVLCTEVLEHVPEPIRVVREIARILRPGGRAFVSAPLGSGLHQEPYHFYGGFTPHFYRKFFTEAGCNIVSIEPNGRFFRLLLQENNRAAHPTGRYRIFPRWHPARWFFRMLRSEIVAHWLVMLDDRVPVSEFTVGYHVEVVRK